MSRKADKIDSDTFYSLVEQYADVVNAGLEELDEFRYKQLPQGDISRKKNEDDSWVGMNKADLQRLVEWKLRHGTYRPSLTKLVASNSEEDVLRVTSTAFTEYSTATDSDSEDLQERVKQAIRELTGLKGVGPATASLVLSCFRPNEVPFFSDELYRWLHWDDQDPKAGTGWDRKIKYTAKEYASLLEKASELRERLMSDTRLDCIEMEKAAYVLGKQEVDLDADTADQSATASASTKKPKDDNSRKRKTVDEEPNNVDKATDSRRTSKRTRTSTRRSSEEQDADAEETAQVSQDHQRDPEADKEAEAAWRKHINRWPARTPKENNLTPGTKPPRVSDKKTSADQEKAIAQGPKNPVLNVLGYPYCVRVCKSSRTSRGGAAKKANFMEKLLRMDEEKKRVREIMGWTKDKNEMPPSIKQRWQDRVARDLNVPFHCVDPECYEEWARRGHRLEEGEYEDEISQVEDDRLMFLMEGSGLLVGYYEALDGKHQY